MWDDAFAQGEEWTMTRLEALAIVDGISEFDPVEVVQVMESRAVSGTAAVAIVGYWTACDAFWARQTKADVMTMAYDYGRAE